jgi:hypothetical protein
MGHTMQDSANGKLALQPGEWPTDAKVDAITEGEMPIL